ncbi:MAG: tetratricopeptide repeat protein [Bdellovibrionota bacterium]
MSLKFIVLGLFIFVFTGCLMTRNDVKEIETKQVLHRQVTDLQKNTADSGSRFAEVDEQLRYIHGRLETLEAKVSKNDLEADRSLKTQSESLQETHKKMSIYQEALTKLEIQMHQNSAEIANLKSEMQKSTKESTRSSKDSKDGKKDSLNAAQDLFKQKDWQNAIIEFQKYRDKNPKGKHVAEATYKIGVCFQELSLKEDAKTFYQEVVASFPNSEEARKAKNRLKGLK